MMTSAISLSLSASWLCSFFTWFCSQTASPQVKTRQLTSILAYILRVQPSHQKEVVNFSLIPAKVLEWNLLIIGLAWNLLIHSTCTCEGRPVAYFLESEMVGQRERSFVAYPIFCPHLCTVRVLGFTAGGGKGSSCQAVVGTRQASIWWWLSRSAWRPKWQKRQTPTWYPPSLGALPQYKPITSHIMSLLCFLDNNRSLTVPRCNTCGYP